MLVRRVHWEGENAKFGSPITTMMIKKLLGLLGSLFLLGQLNAQVYCEPTADCSQND